MHPNTRRLRLPDILWVEIPAGTFRYGERKETRHCDRFWIAKYPVTNAQYQTFSYDGGYADERWWQDLKRPQPQASHWPQPNRPCTNVDWYEAIAFCRWFTARLGLAPGAIRLPTEVEWERAARGTDGRAWPWGEDFRPGLANLNETSGERGPWYLKETTAVGVYPQGRSPEGVMDLAGNVWEWCLNRYDEPQNVAIDRGSASRVVRGGSWRFDPAGARGQP